MSEKARPAENPPEICTDHYMFWRLLKKDVEEKVTLKGQFDDVAFTTSLTAVEYLGNPARKMRKGREPEDIHHASVHLLAYEIGEKHHGPKFPVNVRNQFTDAKGHQWKLGDTSWLLIPARKAKGDEPDPTGPPPRRVDHYLCYDVLEYEGPGIEETMTLSDQFITSEIVYLKPRLFGVPVDKNGEGIIHPEVHLAIYELYPRVTPPVFIGARTWDQLRRRELNTVESIWLGVPSLKRIPE